MAKKNKRGEAIKWNHTRDERDACLNGKKFTPMNAVPALKKDLPHPFQNVSLGVDVVLSISRKLKYRNEDFSYHHVSSILIYSDLYILIYSDHIQ